MNIKKNSRGTWEAFVFLGHDQQGVKRSKHLTAKTKGELLEKIEKAKSVLNADNVKEMESTVIECVDRYIDRRRGKASPKTIREYIGYKQKFPELHNIKLKDLTDRRIQEAIDKASVGHSPKSIQNWWGLFRSAIAYYKREFNPRLELPQKVKPRFEMPERDKLFEMLEGIKGSVMEAPILLACFTGLRRGEISCLNLAEDVVYEYGNKGYVKVSKDMVQCEDNTWVVKEPKTYAANRIVPIPDIVLERLEAYRDDPKYKIPTPNSISKNWQRMRHKWDIDCSFHGLRHYFASLMAAENIPMKYQRGLLGHTTDSMTMRYQEYLKEQKLEVNERLTERINAILTGEKFTEN